MPQSLQVAALQFNRITAILLVLLLLAIVSNALAQPTLTIGTNTHVVSTGAVQFVYGGGALTSNGSLNVPAGSLIANGPTTYGGSGTATVANVIVSHTTGSSPLNSLLSVTGTTTLNANAAINATGVNYYRLTQTDYNGTRSLHKIIALSRENQPPVLFPNPVGTLGEATLEPALSHRGYQLIDVQGRVLLQQAEPGTLSRVSLALLPAFGLHL